MTDHALDALLAEYIAPPVPASLAAHVAAAALALPQEPRAGHARRAVAVRRHDRRGKWLRRPLLLGGVALCLAVSGAVAATLAGFRLDPAAVEAVLGDLPFLGPEPQRPAPPLPPAASPAQAPPAVEPAPVRQAPVAARAQEERPAPRVVEIPADPPFVDAPEPEPESRRRDLAGPKLVYTLPAVQPGVPARAPEREADPPPAAAEREVPPVPVAETRAPAPAIDDSARLRQERIERAERLRATRQAQIERLQRTQQRRERLRRLQRN
jgi:hypothetical protein